MRKLPARPGWLAPLALAAVVALPTVVLTVTMVGSGWRPVGLDMALELLRSWEVGGRHTPLVGAYSRYGWDHPGPLLFVVSAPAVRLLGPEGLLVTAGLVNAVAAGGAVLAAHRTAGLPLALPTAVVTAVMMRALTGAGLVDPWNPYVAVLPFLAYLLCVWGAARGDRVLLVAAVVAGSWCAQAHVGYLPVTVAAVVLGLALRIAHRRLVRPAVHDPQDGAATCVDAGAGAEAAVGAGPGVDRPGNRGQVDRVPARWVVAAVVVGLVLWTPPLLDQLATGRGNLGDLYAFARDGTNPADLEARPVGWSPAVAAMSGMVTPSAPWTTPVGPNQYLEVPDARVGPTATVLVVLALLGGLAWWQRRRGAAALAGLSIALVAVSVVAMARATDGLYGYVIRWSWGIGGLAWIALGWLVLVLLLDVAGRRGPRRAGAWLRPVVGTVAVLAVAVLGVRTVGDGTTARLTDDPAVAAVTGLSRQLRAELDPDVTYELVSDSNWHYLVAPGIAVDLIVHGHDVVVTGDLARQFKPWRVAEQGARHPQVVLVPTAKAGEWRDRHPSARRIAVHEPLTRAERAEPVTGVPHEAWLLEPPSAT